MSLTREVQELRAAVQRLHTAWRELAVTADEDRPPGAGLAAADRIAEVIADGRGDLDEALAQLDRPAPGHALSQAACPLDRMRRRYYEDLCSFGAVGAVLRAVQGAARRESGHEWQAWAHGLRAGIARCAEPLRAVDTILLRCLGELADAATDDVVMTH
ncbi:hypothetical protein FCH28_12920 [Streptomyces piniterrae]|uniref:Uncharacterized protein n=1 Tax=Streptomyces piniterrae TaxID=2571125 RepID=A0A4U0NK08_9ACTN|nr:hypothetical protein [Streptomyces piniterrae]TJZ54102.1 hypothetical protein FCH28_12920 [Streptomyces piniterrae]